MTDTSQTAIEWQDEIWAEQYDGGPCGVYRLCAEATSNSSLSHAKYVHADKFTRMQRYHNAMVDQHKSERAALSAQLEARTRSLDAAFDAALSRVVRSHFKALRDEAMAVLKADVHMKGVEAKAELEADLASIAELDASK